MQKIKLYSATGVLILKEEEEFFCKVVLFFIQHFSLVTSIPANSCTYTSELLKRYQLKSGNVTVFAAII